MALKKRGLGRGLDALLGAQTKQLSAEPVAVDAEKNNNASTHVTPEKTNSQDLQRLPIELIQAGKYQPRLDMRPEALEDLAASIKAQGLMQPIVVRPISSNKYEIIAGERRWRASQMAGLDSIPVIIKDVPDDTAIAMALIENIQREDLNPIEEATALKRLQDEFELTQQEVADAVGKSRTTVTNLIRLMSLNPDVRMSLEHGDLEMGHARALLALSGEHQTKASKTVIGKGMSVRQTEALVRRMLKQPDSTQADHKSIDPDIKQLQDSLSETLGTEVLIQHTAKGKGKVVLKYGSLDQLDGILNHIK
jgi:ParB family chromosome partitioning protein